MNENLIEKLCASPRRWLIVAGGVMLIALVSLLPQVDVYLAARDERADLTEQLRRAKEVLEQLPTYERAAAEKGIELARLREKEVSKDQVTELRSWLVALARTAGCQVRRIDFAAPIRTHWNDNEDPLERNNAKTNNQDQGGPFDLERVPVTLSITGASAEIEALLTALDRDDRLIHPVMIDMRPNDNGSKKIQLDLTLWYFALVDSEDQRQA